jgi:hypothetical protein
VAGDEDLPGEKADQQSSNGGGRAYRDPPPAEIHSWQ